MWCWWTHKSFYFRIIWIAISSHSPLNNTFSNGQFKNHKHEIIIAVVSVTARNENIKKKGNSKCRRFESNIRRQRFKKKKKFKQKLIIRHRPSVANAWNSNRCTHTHEFFFYFCSCLITRPTTMSTMCTQTFFSSRFTISALNLM